MARSARNATPLARRGPTRSRLVLLAVLVFGVMLLVSVQVRQENTGVDQPLAAITVPAVREVREAGEDVNGFFRFFIQMWNAQERVAILEQELAVLREEHLRSQSALRELQQLQRQIGLAPRLPFDVMPALVVINDVDCMLDAVVIDRGSRDGIEVNMPVMSEGKLVGRIERTLPGASRVLLLSDANSVIGVQLPRSGARGLLYGSLTRRSHSLRLELVAGLPDEVCVEDEVVTAEESTLFPPGLPIGKVVKLRMPSTSDATVAIVHPHVELRSLSSVQVVFSTQRRDALALAADNVDSFPVERGRP